MLLNTLRRNPDGSPFEMLKSLYALSTTLTTSENYKYSIYFQIVSVYYKHKVTAQLLIYIIQTQNTSLIKANRT